MAAVPGAASGSGEQAEKKVLVKETMLAKAVKALVQVVAKRTSNENPLFGASTETMTVVFTLASVPEKRRMKPHMIPLPYPMFDDKSEVCFFAKDPQKEYKELLLQKHKIPGLTKVIGIDKLRRNYNTVEAKRALCDAFDLFLCDDRVVEMMPKILGSVFYSKKKKPPIPVRVKPADPRPNLEEAINGTALRMPKGPCLGVRFGKCAMPEEHLVKNALAVIHGAVKYLRKGHVLVRSISVQATDSVALPVWRRAQTPGELLDLKKYHSDATSSAASASGASETEGTETAGIPTSELGDTTSVRDTASESGDGLSELGGTEDPSSMSELDAEAGDVDEGAAAPKEKLPLVQSVTGGKNKKKRKHGAGEAVAPSPVAAPKEPAAAAAAMGPPQMKKAKKAAKA